MTEEPRWNASFPDPDALRAEARAMAGAVASALLAHATPERVKGLYFKGSAHKPWDTPLDYVPEISDVDVHVLFHDDGFAEEFSRSTARALEVQGAMEAEFRRRHPRPLHLPRPQLVVLNGIHDDPDFISSPPATIEVLHGEPYPASDYSRAEAIRQVDARHLAEQRSFLEAFPLRVVDKPGKYIREMLRVMNWRISPAASRLLHLLGEETEDVWSLNRTGLVHRLVEKGKERFARLYASYYLSGWAFFLSGDGDGKAGRSALASGFGAIEESVDHAEAWLEAHSG
jgi:hypothetical protein